MGEPCRIDPLRAHIPQPSSVLFLAMAQAAWSSRATGRTWSQAPEAVQEALISDAKAMYGVVAMHGGALARQIQELTE